MFMFSWIILYNVSFIVVLIRSYRILSKNCRHGAENPYYVSTWRPRTTWLLSPIRSIRCMIQLKKRDGMKIVKIKSGQSSRPVQFRPYVRRLVCPPTLHARSGAIFLLPLLEVVSESSVRQFLKTQLGLARELVWPNLLAFSTIFANSETYQAIREWWNARTVLPL